MQPQPFSNHHAPSDLRRILHQRLYFLEGFRLCCQIFSEVILDDLKKVLYIQLYNINKMNTAETIHKNYTQLQI